MIRHGFRPSNDPRWTKMAEKLIGEAEDEEVSLPEFYSGLVAMMDEIENRLAIGPSECEPAEDDGDN